MEVGNEGEREARGEGAHLQTENGVVVLVAAHRELRRGVEGWIERDEHGAVPFSGEVLQFVHPV